MALPIKQLKAFAKSKLRGQRPEDQEEDEEEEQDEEEEKDASAESESDEGEDGEDEGEEEGEEEDGDDTDEGTSGFLIKLSGQAHEIEELIDEIDADLEGEELDEKAVAKVKGSLGRLPKGARQLIRNLKKWSFPEIEEVVQDLAEDGSVSDSGRFAAWLYCAAQEA